MSPHVYVTKRKTSGGGIRYVVRYRWGGRGFKLLHLGSKQTQREARALRDWAAGELAAARDPRESLGSASAAARVSARAADLARGGIGSSLRGSIRRRGRSGTTAKQRSASPRC
jgi:hypothetical protein